MRKRAVTVVTASPGWRFSCRRSAADEETSRHRRHRVTRMAIFVSQERAAVRKRAVTVVTASPAWRFSCRRSAQR